MPLVEFTLEQKQRWDEHLTECHNKRPPSRLSEDKRRTIAALIKRGWAINRIKKREHTSRETIENIRKQVERGEL